MINILILAQIYFHFPSTDTFFCGAVLESGMEHTVLFLLVVNQSMASHYI